MVAWAFIIAAAMTGIAAADPQSVEPESGVYDYDIPTDGTPVTVKLEISGYIGDWTAGQTHTISATTTWATTDDHINDLQYRFTGGGVLSDWLSSGGTFQWTDDTDPDYVTLEIRAEGNPPTHIEYNIRVDDEWTSPASGVDFGACTIYGESIPEFATIAIPVASILGLLFYFNHRKHRKE